MIPARLSLVTLGTDDLPSLRRFYTGLGWTEVPGSDDSWAAYVLGGVVLSLFPKVLLDEESGAGTLAGAPGAGAGATRTASFTLALNVDAKVDVDRVFLELVNAGANALVPPHDAEWGGRSAYISDPDGNRWEVAWAEGAVFGERGEIVSFGG